ncbi:hypothetical protein AMTRI_Chr06g178380 [Amborella trichopoda]|uniref:Cytochrome P450 n=1 Tax=Amborella trichopoda TaxID=13333 RepID=U5DI61_AMBTC|nr:hypothetical protein AMTR_s00066p00165020 [Amborella trichopoda]
MDLVWVLAFFSFLAAFYVIKSKISNVNFPPGPPSLPFIGHFHILKPPLHRTLSHLSKKYGPIFWLRLGMKPVVVVSSPILAKECFTTNDIAFASRPRTAAGKYLGYDYISVVWAPYGDHWRTLRKIQTVELLSSKKIEMFANVRREQVAALFQSLLESSDEGEVVNMKDKITETIFSVIVKIVANKSYYGCGVEDLEVAKEFREVIDETFVLTGKLNLGDYIPFLRWIDLQGMTRLMKLLQRRRDRIMQGIVDEHRKLRSSGGGQLKPDFVHLLLDMKDKDPEYFTDDLIKSTIVVMITAGTETTAVTIEWVLALLLNHPEALQKAQTELDQQVGRERLVEESDLPKLEYLRAVLYETLRLYPPGPTLVPHESNTKCTLGGYTIPKGTLLLVNAWHIHRDPDVWPEPLSFKPERFIESDIDVKGQDFRVIPFGSGRRSCPGMGLALRSVEFVLANLLHAFEWRREGTELLDMSEGVSLTMPRAVPLKAFATPRLSRQLYPIA